MEHADYNSVGKLSCEIATLQERSGWKGERKWKAVDDRRPSSHGV